MLALPAELGIGPTTGSFTGTLYEGTSVDDLTVVPMLPGGSGLVVATLEPGLTYSFQVASDQTAGVNGNLYFLYGTPANDDFADALVLPAFGAGGTIPGRLVAATVEPAEPRPADCAAAPKTAWYQITPTVNGRLELFLIRGSSPATPLCLTVYGGSTLAGLSELATATFSGNAHLVRPVTGNTTYHIAIAGGSLANPLADLPDPSLVFQLTVDVPADVAITKTADHNTSDNPLAPGGRLVYTLAITNAGPAAATGIQVSDVLPSTSTPNDAAWCEVVAPATSCDTTIGTPFGSSSAIPPIATLGAGQTRRFQVGYTVGAMAPTGLMQNTASITSSTTDPTPANNSSTVTVLVDVPPVASFSFTPTSPITGDQVRFDASTSSDADGITAYSWSFDDGTFGTGQTPTHAYATQRGYNVTLTVTDALGGMATTAHSIDVRNPGGPPAHRVLRGTVTQLVPFAPGGDPAGGRVPFAGAVVTVGSARQGIQTTVDAQGRYIFTNLTCSPCQVAVATAAGQQLAQASVTLERDPSTTVRDFTVGNPPDQLFVTGRVVPPFVFPGDPPPADPATLAIRVTGPGFNDERLGVPGRTGRLRRLPALPRAARRQGRALARQPGPGHPVRERDRGRPRVRRGAAGQRRRDAPDDRGGPGGTGSGAFRPPRPAGHGDPARAVRAGRRPGRRPGAVRRGGGHGRQRPPGDPDDGRRPGPVHLHQPDLQPLPGRGGDGRRPAARPGERDPPAARPEHDRPRLHGRQPARPTVRDRPGRAAVRVPG